MTASEKRTILHKTARIYYHHKSFDRGYSIKRLTKEINDKIGGRIGWNTMYRAIVKKDASQTTLDLLNIYISSIS